MRKCIYCKSQLFEGDIPDFCERCGKGVFGEKMFQAIIQNMTEAKQRGDLEQTRG